MRARYLATVDASQSIIAISRHLCSHYKSKLSEYHIDGGHQVVFNNDTLVKRWTSQYHP